jgi:hypothetical protein
MLRSDSDNRVYGLRLRRRRDGEVISRLATIVCSLIHYIVAIACSFSVNQGKKCLINYHEMIMGHGTLFR